MGTPSVFVHLGKNPSPQLNSMASIAKISNPETSLFLITDEPGNWENFPGKLINYSRSNRNQFLSELSRQNREMEQISGGYWFYTLERIYALEEIYTEIPANQSFLHYESDVMPLLRESDCQLLIEKRIRTAVPRFSKERGIASVLFSPSQDELNRALKEFNKLFLSKYVPVNDMDILGRALNSKVIDELPTLPEDAWVNSTGERVLFDGAAIGQYLFGQDPYHTDNRRISGFINPHYQSPIESWNWKVETNYEKNKYLLATIETKEYRILNIHVHSKILLPAPDGSQLWRKAILEANGTIIREPGEVVVNQIHTKPINLINRIRIARKKGLYLSILMYLKRKIKSYVHGLKND